MNCKPGDLAMNVRGLSSYRGEIYTVLRPYDGPWVFDGKKEPSWRIDRMGEECHACDSDLRPLRNPGDDEKDETLVFARKPSEEHA